MIALAPSGTTLRVRRLLLLQAVLLLPSAGAAPRKPTDAGVSDASVASPAELEVTRTDAGLVVRPSPDAGEAQLTPPALEQDSPARYPEAALAERLHGEVGLLLTVDAQGEVQDAEVSQPLHPLLDAAALHAAASLRFAPARLGEVAVAVRLPFTYRFEPPAAQAPQIPEGRLTGRVRAKGNRAPVVGAAVSAGGHSAQTDVNGAFTLSLPAGTQAVTVSAAGHKPASFSEQVRAGEALEVLYALEPLVVNPYETIVRGERVRTEVSRVSLEKQELREVPGTMGDPFRVVMLMPGVASVVSGLAYPVVRGSQPAATGYFLDGIRVPLLFHLFLGPAVVHPDFIEGIDFYPGAAPPQYGRLMGGVIDGRVSRPREQGFHGTVYADLINAGAFVEYPIEQTGTSISLAGRISYTPWVLALISNVVQPAPPPGLTNPSLVLDFFDYQARIEQRIGEGRLRLFAFGSSDVFGTRIDPETSVTRTAGTQAIVFHRADLRYRQPLGKGEAEIGVTYGVDRLEFNSVTPEGESLFRIEENKVAGRVGYRAPIAPGLQLSSGMDLDHRRSTLSLGARLAVGPDGSPGAPLPGLTVFSQPAVIGTFFGAYAELIWQRIDRLTLTTGARFDNYHLTGGVNRIAFEPRLTARYALLESLTLKGGVGFYHQPPTTLITLPVVDMAGLAEGLQEAIQVDVGAEWRLFRGLELNVDAYVNPLLHTLELDLVNSGGSATAGLPSSYGLAYGLEVMLRHPVGEGWFGWLSYSLQRSTRFERWSRYDEHGRVVGTSTGIVPFVFDQTHLLNAVLSYKFKNNITAGVSFHLNSGRPEAGGVTSRTQREGSTLEGVPRWVPVDRDQQDRLPPFFRLDVRVAKAWAFDTFALEVYLDVLNVTVSQEVVAFDYRDDALGPSSGALQKLPTRLPLVLPTLGVKATY